MNKKIRPFRFMECAVLPLATGISAQTLRELRSAVSGIPDSSIYYHFWGRMIRPHISESEFNNDFASWVNNSIKDIKLAEVLSAINPDRFQKLNEIRVILENILDKRLENEDFLSWKKADRDFYFISCKKLMFETSCEASLPEELPSAVKKASRQSFFYHFIDGRRRSPECKDDFTQWLEQFPDETQEARKKIQKIDPYLFSLEELKEQIASLLEESFGKGGENTDV